MTIGLSDIYKNQDTILDRVVLYLGTDGNAVNPSEITAPSGYEWSDFEEIVFTAGVVGTSVVGVTTTVCKEEILLNPTSWEVAPRLGWAYYTHYIASTTTTLDFSSNNNNVGLISVIGYTKRYATQNVSAIINVNGGENVTTDQRYEIDIASALGQDYVGKDLIVKAEVYYSGTNTANHGWGDGGKYTDGNGSRFAYATVFGDKIIVQTGFSGVIETSRFSGNPFGNTDTAASAPCRVKVWKIDQFVTNTAGTSNSYEFVHNTVTGGRYRKWNDGVLEQWGGSGVIAAGGSQKLYFPHPFAEGHEIALDGGNRTNTYHVTVSSKVRNGVNISTGSGGVIGANTNEYFTMCSGGEGTNQGEYYAIGYWK